MKKGLGIRQGMPLSPFLSNLFLYDFDQAIIEYNLKAVRYADDLIFFAKSKKECKEIYNICFKELGKFGLSIPAISNTEVSKTKIASPEDEIDFLGLSIKRNNNSYEPVVNEKQMRAIRTELGHLKDINTLNSKGIALYNLGTHINSKILGYKNAYKECKNKIDLYNMLDGKKIEIFEDVYNKLGIEIGKLSNSKKTFLGIN